MKALAYLLISCSFASVALGQGIGCNQVGECQVGVEDNSIVTSDDVDCLIQCKYNPRCILYSFYPTLNTCNLFDSCIVFNRTSCTDCTSGDSTCDIPNDRECFLRGACTGEVTITGPIAVNDPNACLNVSTFSTIYVGRAGCLPNPNN